MRTSRTSITRVLFATLVTSSVCACGTPVNVAAPHQATSSVSQGEDATSALGELTTTPDACVVDASGKCAVTLTWTANDATANVEVFVVVDDGPPELYACGAGTFSDSAPWIQAGHVYAFTAYQSRDCAQTTIDGLTPLATAWVNGLASSLPPQADLVCNMAWEELPPTTETATVGGETTGVDVVAVRFGINHDLGGVGTTFQLINLYTPFTPLDVLEARGAAGSGWQTVYWGDYDGDLVMFNQSTGNAVGYQWGVSNTYGVTNTSAASASMVANNWRDLPSERVTASTGDATSPCDGTSVTYDEGRLALGAQLQATAHGRAVTVSNALTMRAKADEQWNDRFVTQAFYLSKAVAGASDLRVYLHGDGWSYGPLRPYTSGYTVGPYGQCGQDAFPDSWMCNIGDVDADGVNSLSYVVLVWNVFGLDIGVAVVPPGGVMSMGTDNMIYCGHAGEPPCVAPYPDSVGTLWVYFWPQRSFGPVTYRAGTSRAYKVTYQVGTLQQLADLGFATPGYPGW